MLDNDNTSVDNKRQKGNNNIHLNEAGSSVAREMTPDSKHNSGQKISNEKSTIKRPEWLDQSFLGIKISQPPQVEDQTGNESPQVN